MTLSISFLYVFNWSDIHTLAILYTDPGSGALIWQLLVASFVGILFYVRSFIRRITAMMPGRKSKEESNQRVAVDRDSSAAPNRNTLQ
jgi:hypothetical protein